MARYLILIYGDEARWDAESAQEREAKGAAHAEFVAAARDAGGTVAGGELEAASTATSLRAGPAGRPLVTDGPFLESKEVLGGFYVVEAADLDGALALAARLPEVAVDHSGVEIRPLVERS
jgi:hypothetical protein